MPKGKPDMSNASAYAYNQQGNGHRSNVSFGWERLLFIRTHWSGYSCQVHVVSQPYTYS